MLWTLKLAPDSEARIQIMAVLKKRFRIENIESSQTAQLTADEILARIKMPQERSMYEIGEEVFEGAISEALWYHTQLSGLTAGWELRVRFLAIKLGIRPNVPIPDKSKQNRANKSVQHRSLKNTIEEVQRLTGGRLDLRLFELAGLRDSIVHCNPHGMRAYAKQLLGKQKVTPLRGNVVVASFGQGNSPRNLSDIEDEAEAEDQDLFGWFIEVFNSGLPKVAYKEFEDSMRSLNVLTLFHSLCFDDRADTFEKVVIRGNQPDEKDIAKFQAYFSAPYSTHKDLDANQFFSEVTSCFRALTWQKS